MGKRGAYPAKTVAQFLISVFTFRAAVFLCANWRRKSRFITGIALRANKIYREVCPVKHGLNVTTNHSVQKGKFAHGDDGGSVGLLAV